MTPQVTGAQELEITCLSSCAAGPCKPPVHLGYAWSLETFPASLAVYMYIWHQECQLQPCSSFCPSALLVCPEIVRS